MTVGSREIALDALADRHGNVSGRLERLCDEAGCTSADRALATELALGVVRRRNTLKEVMRSLLTSPRLRLQGGLINLLQISLYQILFLDRVPNFAAVDEAVKIAHKKFPKRSGLVNAVLRSATRKLTDVQQGTPRPAADVLPLSPSTYVVFDKAIFADPQIKPAMFISQACSLPEAIAERWLARFGGLKKAFSLGLQCNARAPLIARVNTLKTDVATVIERLSTEGIKTIRHRNGVSIVIVETAGLLTSDVFAEGLIQPQDATATNVSLLADPKPGWRVLDMCAAPGTKTTHLAELMRNKGSVLAVDIQEKLSRISENCRRMGIDIVETMSTDKLGSLEPGSFDLVLVDVPCSNTGVLARRAEARWRFDSKHLSQLMGDQFFLASTAGIMVRPGGRVVYSTCSIEAEEGHDVIEKMLKQNSSLRLESEKLILPEGTNEPANWRDGGYYAILRK